MKIIRVLFFVIVLLLIIPRTVKAEDCGFVQFYTEQDGLGIRQQIFFASQFTVSEKALFLFDNLLNPTMELVVTAIPEKTSLTRVKFYKGDLTVDITSAILNFGGNQREKEVIYQLLSTAFSLKGVERFTLLIDGVLKELPESSILLYYSRKDYYFIKESMGY